MAESSLPGAGDGVGARPPVPPRGRRLALAGGLSLAYDLGGPAHRLARSAPLREGTASRAITQAGRRAALGRRPTAHGLWHASATHLPEAGYDVRTAQELPGHSSVGARRSYSHMLNRGGRGVRSPLDRP